MAALLGGNCWISYISLKINSLDVVSFRTSWHFSYDLLLSSACNGQNHFSTVIHFSTYTLLLDRNGVLGPGFGKIKQWQASKLNFWNVCYLFPFNRDMQLLKFSKNKLTILLFNLESLWKEPREVSKQRNLFVRFYK